MALSKPVLALTICSAAVSLLYGCHALVSADSNANPPAGVDCAVEFRPPLPGSLSSMDLKGKLKLANDKWIVLIMDDKKPDEGEFWIPREDVFLIVVGKSSNTYKGLN